MVLLYCIYNIDKQGAREKREWEKGERESDQ
jgi:hypothetical protein